MAFATIGKQITTPSTPNTGYARLFFQGTECKYVDDTGTVYTLSTGTTAEQIQDVVGAFVANTATLNWTYNDAGNTLTANVVPSAIDHNALLNYSANRHIDHSAVSITAGTGLTGGGDITASRSLAISNTGVTASAYGSATATPIITVNSQGQLTAAGAVTVTPAWTSITSKPTTVSGYGITDVTSQPLTGLSAGPDAAILSTDSILTALAKLQAQLDAMDVWQELVATNTYTSSSIITGTQITDLAFGIVAGSTYYVEFTLLYQSTASGTGIAVTITSPDGGSGPGALMGNIQVAADGTAAGYMGTINALNDYITSTGVQTANTNFIVNLKGTFVANATGTFVPAFRSETGAQVSIQPGSVALVRTFT